MGAKEEQRACGGSVGRVELQGTRNWDEARAPLATAYASFTEGLETADLRDARALLQELA